MTAFEFKTNGDSLIFGYDPTGNRIMKTYWNDSLQTRKATYHVRDASGNVMATYEHTADTLRLSEWALYGSSRIGVVSPDLQLHPVLPVTTDPLLAGVSYYTLNEKQYELSNHLGNVQATISDRRMPVYASSGFSHYEAEVVSAQDYYPFGMLMPERSFSNEKYRYGFNGKETDNEVKGICNSIDFGARIHDPRLMRFLSIDPLSKNFPSESNYSYTGNSPILFVDREGEKKTIYIYVIDNNGNTTKHTLVNERDVRLKTYNAYGGAIKAYTADVQQTVIIDLKNNSMQVGAEQFTLSKQNYVVQKAKNAKDHVSNFVAPMLDALGISDGRQAFGYNVYSSEGVNSPAFEEIKGKADIVENFDISGMVIPKQLDRDIGGALEKLGEVNRDVKAVADIFSKSFENAANVIEIVEKAVEVSKDGKSGKTPYDTICTGGCGGPYHGTFDGIERNKNKDSIGTVPAKK